MMQKPYSSIICSFFSFSAFFSVTVDDAKTVLLDNLLVLLLLRFLLLLASVFALLRQFLEMLVNCSKVTLLQVPDNFFLFVVHYSSPILHKVLVEDLLGGVVVLYHLAVEGRNLLRVDGQSHMLAIVVELDVFR